MTRNPRAGMSRGTTSLLAFLLCVSGSLWLAPPSHANDWPQLRGPEQTGVSRDKGTPDKFSVEDGTNVLWKQPYGGRTTPIIMNGRVYVINPTTPGVTEEERLHLQERVMCLDADTGKVLWEHRFNGFHTDIVAARVGWTTCVGDPETGNVYAHGIQGLLFCFDGKTGDVKWQKSLTEEFGRISGYGGRITSPIVDEDLVILGMVNANWGEYARGGNRFVAMDKKTGDIVWWSETGHQVRDTYYSTPVVAVINGQRVLITGGGDGGVHAFQVRTGKKLWSHLFSSGAVNVAPVVNGSLVYICHGEENLEGGQRGQLLCLDASQVSDGKPKVVWSVEGKIFKFASPLLHEGRLYVCDEGATMYCYDAKSGKQLWRYSYGRSGKGSPVWADGKIYLTAVGGDFHIVRPTEKGAERLFRTRIDSRHPGVALEMNGGAAIANGRLYFMTSEDLYCIGSKEASARAEPIPAPPAEPKADANAPAAHLQVVPADVTLTPGGSASFRARLFDAQGRFLREAKAEWSAVPFTPPPPAPGAAAQPGEPPPPLQGKVSPEGQLTVSDKVPSQFGGVLAKADGLEGRARVRVAPVLPYSQDFQRVPVNRTPGGWVNAMGKFLVKELDGHKVLAKNNTTASTLVARANTFITLPSARDYTIIAEVMGRPKGDDWPDMGVINSRYTLELAGKHQQVRLLSWDRLPRIDKGVVFPWKAGVWYVMKLTVEPTTDGKATIKGKVWEKGRDEPADWTVTFVDPQANTEGAAGLYGFSTGIEEKAAGSEVYYQNVKITPNKK